MIKKEFSLKHNSDDLIAAIGKRTNSTKHAVFEFLDNFLSNVDRDQLKDRSFRICLNTIEGSQDTIRINFEDDGPGIEDFSTFFSIGRNNSVIVPLNNTYSFLNYYHIGAKQSFGYFNPANDAWTILTRTQDDASTGLIRKVSAPFNVTEMIEEVYSDTEIQWSGKNSYGTVISIDTSINTILNILNIHDPDFAGSITEEIKQACTMLNEMIGFEYEHILTNNKNIHILIDSDVLEKPIAVAPIEPVWDDPEHFSKNLNWDLGFGTVPVHVEYGLIQKGKNRLYYTGRSITTGLEVAIDYRKYEYGNMDIWDVKPQFHHDRFLFRVHIKSCEKKKVPMPLSDKNGLDKNDTRTQKLFQSIRKLLSRPLRDDDAPKKKAHDLLVDELESRLKANNSNLLTEKKKSVGERYGRNSIELDLYTNVDNVSTVYEAKVSTIGSKELSQVLLYIYMCKICSPSVDEFVLVGINFNPDIEQLVDDINNRHCLEGIKTKILLRTWSDYGIEILSSAA